MSLAHRLLELVHMLQCAELPAWVHLRSPRRSACNGVPGRKLGAALDWLHVSQACRQSRTRAVSLQCVYQLATRCKLPQSTFPARVQQVWWNADIIIIGDPGLKKDHDVIQFLAKEGRAASLGYFRDGVDAVEKAFPFLVGQSLKPHRDLVYPSPVVDRSVFLGNWNSAADADKLAHLKISRLVTIHNEPKNLKFPSAVLCVCAALLCLRSELVQSMRGCHVHFHVVVIAI
jgi:hypothetical protein